MRHMVSPRGRRAVLMLSWLGLWGCGDDDAPKHIDSAACSAGALESDLDAADFQGPAVGADGKLALQAGQTFVVSSTYGQPIPGPGGAPVTQRYLDLFTNIQTQLASQQGLLAFRLASSDACASGRTLAIWESEDAMYGFVTSAAHTAAMMAVHDVLKPSYAVTHWSGTSVDQTSFAYAATQLAADTK